MTPYIRPDDLMRLRCGLDSLMLKSAGMSPAELAHALIRAAVKVDENVVHQFIDKDITDADSRRLSFLISRGSSVKKAKDGRSTLVLWGDCGGTINGQAVARRVIDSEMKEES